MLMILSSPVHSRITGSVNNNAVIGCMHVYCVHVQCIFACPFEWFCMEFLHAVRLFVMHIDVTPLTSRRSTSPVQVVAAPTTITKPTVVTKPTIATKPKEDSQSQPVVKHDTAVRQADVG